MCYLPLMVALWLTQALFKAKTVSHSGAQAVLTAPISSCVRTIPPLQFSTQHLKVKQHH